MYAESIVVSHDTNIDIIWPIVIVGENKGDLSAAGKLHAMFKRTNAHLQPDLVNLMR